MRKARRRFADRHRIALPQADGERFLQPHQRRQREGPAAGERLFQRRQADLGDGGELLAGHAASRQFLRDEIGGDTAFGARQRLFQTARHERSLFHPNP